MPVWYVLVCDSGCDIEHDDTALSIDVVSITETTELLLTSSVPDIELNWAQVLPRMLVLKFGSGHSDRGRHMSDVPL